MSQSTNSKLQTIHDTLRREIQEQHQLGDRLPTEQELAVRFSCSVATISKALSLLAHDGWVERRPRAGTKVLRTSPGVSAGRTSDLKLDAVAYVYPSEKHGGMWRTVRAFQEAATEADSRVLTITTGADCEKEIEFLGRISEFDVRGAVVHPVLLTPSQHARFAQKLIECPVPVVLSSMALSGSASLSVGIDAFHAGYTMAKHLIDRGCRRIGFISNMAKAVERFYAGHQWAMEMAGITPDPVWDHLDHDMHPDYDEPQREPYQVVCRYLDRKPGVDGVVCPYDGMAVALIQAAQERGIRVPQDLRVVGIDDLEVAGSSPVPLTTYHVPFEEIGRKQFEVLKATISGSFRGFHRINVRGWLVERASA